MAVVFKEIEQKALAIQENYKKTQELIDSHKVVLDETKTEYNKLKKTMEEFRASEVDDQYKLQDMKKLLKEWEMKVKAFNKRLEEVQSGLVKHIEQIQRDAVDPEKVLQTLSDTTLNDACDMRQAMEMVALLEAQLKDMNPNLDSITEKRPPYIMNVWKSSMLQHRNAMS